MNSWAANPTGSALKVRGAISKFGAIGAQSQSGGHTRQRTTALRQTFRRLRLTCRRDPASGSLLRHIAHLRCMDSLASVRIATISGSDFSCPCIIGYGFYAFPTRAGQPEGRPVRREISQVPTRSIRP